MPETLLSREQYVQKVLEAYQRTPGTTGQVRPPDRLLAGQIQQRGIPLQTVENALVLAAARRIFRPPEAPLLTTVRSLAYFIPVIEELLTTQVSEDYFQHLRRKLEPFYSHAPRMIPARRPARMNPDSSPAQFPSPAEPNSPR